MRAHLTAALTAVLAVTAAPHALAAKAACLQVVDAAGDGTSLNGLLPNRDALDIRSADLATGRRHLVAVVRLASLADDPTLTPGVSYTFAWTAGGTGQAVTLLRYSNGDTAARYDPDTASGAGGDEVAVAALVDTAAATVTWTVPRATVPALRKAGARFTGLAVFAEAMLNLAEPEGSPMEVSGSIGILGGDSASSGKSYTDRTPSCVKGV